tara:strand:+ start:125 stop:286 length:162 start_codon:yes stop_codon:yes gene_type:complete
MSSDGHGAVHDFTRVLVGEGSHSKAHAAVTQHIHQCTQGYIRVLKRTSGATAI